jgi:hypothetical protein
MGPSGSGTVQRELPVNAMDVDDTGALLDTDLGLNTGSSLPPTTPPLPSLDTNIIDLQPVQPRLPPIRVLRPRYVEDQLPDPVPTLPRRVILVVRDQLTTAVNSLGLWRKYLHRPTFALTRLWPPRSWQSLHRKPTRQPVRCQQPQLP